MASSKTSIPAVPIRTKLTDESGNLARPWVIFFQQLVGPQQITGTHAERAGLLPSDVQPGSTFYETDTGITYTAVLSAGGVQTWVYTAGTQRGTLSPNTKPTLTAGDAGYLWYSTDYEHTFRWNGTAWAYAPGELGSKFVAYFDSVPGAGKWQIADGTATQRANSTATLVAVTVPNLIGKYAKGATAYTGTPVASAITGSTDAGGAHAHTVLTFQTDANGAGSIVQAGTGINVAAFSHQHFVSSSPGTSTSATHTHTLTGATGDPAHLDMIPYYRL